MKGRTALITGVTSGIGLATARAVIAAGGQVIGVGRRADRLQNLDFETHVLDVRDAAACEHLLPTLKAADILINNAGLALGVEPVASAHLEQWETMVHTNVMGLMRMTRLLLPQLIKAQGDIVQLGSVAGRWVYPGGAVYCATKHAVRAFSEGLRMDLAGTGVRVVNIEPGMVETEFSNVRLGDADKAKNVYVGMTPLAADDIARAIVWSLSQPRHVNIQELVIFPTEQAAVGQVHRRPAPPASAN